MNKEIIKRRNINVRGINCYDCENTIRQRLREIDGIKKVTMGEKGRVTVEYNLLKTNLYEIEKIIRHIGYVVASNILER